jgi:hypothetical protein
MASAQQPNRVYFTSLDRSPIDSNTDFTISFDTPIENSKNFEVVSSSFPNTFRQFASYETILYFYHEQFQGGTIAIGVPMSLTPFAGQGKTGENAVPASRPTGRKQYIDGRYFVDGDDLTTYLNDWIQSLSATGGTNFPASTTGLCPFYFADDDPTNQPTFFANEAATGVDFSKLSFTYDNTTALGGEGSLKLVFEDSDGNDVRIASILDFGNLAGTTNYPSLMCYKLGYTSLEYEAFNDVVSVTASNNAFTMSVTVNGQTYRQYYTIEQNDYTADGFANQILFSLRTTAIPAPSQVFNLVGQYSDVTATLGVLTFDFSASPTTGLAVTIDFDPTDPVQQACKTIMGFTANTNSTTTGSTLTAPSSVVYAGSITPAAHVAPDPINLIRTSSVYIASSLSAGEALTSAGRKDVLFCVPLTAPIGSVQLYQSSLSGIIVNRPPSVVRNLRLTLLDDNFQVMEPMPQNSSVSVEIHFSYDDENNVNNVSTNPYANK